MKRVLMALAAILALGQSALAADISVEPGNGGPALIRLTGVIVQDDADKFQGIASGYSSAFVMLDSHGGSVFDALTMGKLIREKHFITVVTGDTICTSSCALIWLAGTPRLMAANARIGFHAAYMTNDNGEKVTTGFGNAMIGAYLEKLGLSDRAIYYVTKANPDEVTWLAYDEASAKGIEVRLFPTNPAQPVQPTQTVAQRVSPPVGHIGPSFDCAVHTTEVRQFICTDADLSRADLEFVQPFLVLRHVFGPSAWKALTGEAIEFHNALYETCHINPTTGALLMQPVDTKACMLTQYAKQRAIWLGRLSGAGLQEAMRPITQHIALQARLQVLGFLPASEKLDGVYSIATRTAIVNWQHSVGAVESGLIGVRDAAQLAQAAPQANSPPASAQGDTRLVHVVAETFKKNYTEHGISGVIIALQNCYQHSETTTESARVCMLYDMVGYRVDRGYTEALGNPSLRQPYFADQAFDERIKHYAGAVFGGWNAEARDFLALSTQIVAAQ